MTTPQLPSKRASSFKKLYGQLLEKAQHEANEAYRQFKAHPDYPGLRELLRILETDMTASPTLRFVTRSTLESGSRSFL